MPSFSMRVLLLAGMMLVLCAIAPTAAGAREGKGYIITHDPAWCEELYFITKPEPWPCPPADADGDGVGNNRDKCPNTPSGYRVNADGCPSDGDSDGVFDGADRCPDTPRGTKVDSRGCQSPVVDGDRDGDGVNDSADRCPGTPRETTVGSDGCPPRVTPPPPPTPAIVAPGERLVLEGVTFATGKATLTGSSTDVLDRVAHSLKAKPDVRIEIGGHTDNAGNDAHNQSLSEQRAGAVRDYLVGQGVDRSRIEIRGYGETMPVADNATPEGRARNRRVEIKRAD